MKYLVCLLLTLFVAEVIQSEPTKSNDLEGFLLLPSSPPSYRPSAFSLLRRGLQPDPLATLRNQRERHIISPSIFKEFSDKHHEESDLRSNLKSLSPHFLNTFDEFTNSKQTMIQEQGNGHLEGILSYFGRQTNPRRVTWLLLISRIIKLENERTNDKREIRILIRDLNKLRRDLGNNRNQINVLKETMNKMKEEIKELSKITSTNSSSTTQTVPTATTVKPTANTTSLSNATEPSTNSSSTTQTVPTATTVKPTANATSLSNATESSTNISTTKALNTTKPSTESPSASFHSETETISGMREPSEIFDLLFITPSTIADSSAVEIFSTEEKSSQYSNKISTEETPIFTTKISIINPYPDNTSLVLDNNNNNKTIPPRELSFTSEYFDQSTETSPPPTYQEENTFPTTKTTNKIEIFFPENILNHIRPTYSEDSHSAPKRNVSKQDQKSETTKNLTGEASPFISSNLEEDKLNHSQGDVFASPSKLDKLRDNDVYEEVKSK
ncbi:hypothetical protein Avbf_18246 [Armadillidium vulgare]|nr:hypothetical protein Avbf_18246 [Armadillidium vulgare]